LNQNYLYLLIDLLCIVFPFIASFYRKAPFYKKWRYLSIAIGLPAVLFIIWDEIFTALGIWGFNPNYVTGFRIESLPIEEILFFICVPYACVFTYFALRYFIQKDLTLPYQNVVSFIAILLLLIAGIYHFEKLYTTVTFISLSFLLAYLTFKVRAPYLGHFYLTFGLIMIPFLLVNGILTGSFIQEEIVWYNNTANLGFRIGTIPIEDFFYAMLMLLSNISIFEWLELKSSRGSMLVDKSVSAMS